MLGEAVVIAGVFAGFRAVLATHVRPVFIDGTFVVRR